MLKINNKQHYRLFILLTILLITGCEEGDEDVIIGKWTINSFEEYENMDCTGLLEDSPFFDMFNYSETYEIRDGGFTWSQTSDWHEDPYTEEGTYETTTTDTSIVYTLLGTTTNHGNRQGYIGEDGNSMSITLQWDTDSDSFQLFDTCFKFTYGRIQ